MNDDYRPVSRFGYHFSAYIELSEKDKLSILAALTGCTMTDMFRKMIDAAWKFYKRFDLEHPIQDGVVLGSAWFADAYNPERIVKLDKAFADKLAGQYAKQLAELQEQKSINESDRLDIGQSRRELEDELRFRDARIEALEAENQKLSRRVGYTGRTSEGLQERIISGGLFDGLGLDSRWIYALFLLLVGGGVVALVAYLMCLFFTGRLGGGL
jgi:hypothetical protein